MHVYIIISFVPHIHLHKNSYIRRNSAINVFIRRTCMHARHIILYQSVNQSINDIVCCTMQRARTLHGPVDTINFDFRVIHNDIFGADRSIVLVLARFPISVH